MLYMYEFFISLNGGMCYKYVGEYLKDDNDFNLISKTEMFS